MKRDPSVTNHKNSEKYSDKFLSWEELFEKGTLLRNTIKQLSLTPGAFYSVTKSCTDGTFQAGDVITLEVTMTFSAPNPGNGSHQDSVRKKIWIFYVCRPVTTYINTFLFTFLFQGRLQKSLHCFFHSSRVCSTAIIQNYQAVLIAQDDFIQRNIILCGSRFFSLYCVLFLL